MKLNLGCGKDYRDDCINTDVSKNTKADYYFDVSSETFPFPDNYFDEIYCSGVLEQILENKGLINALNECHRVLKIGGIITIIVPNATLPIGHQDPMDCRKFTIPTFDYFIEGQEHYNNYGFIYGFLSWKMVSIKQNENGIIIAILKK